MKKTEGLKERLGLVMKERNQLQKAFEQSEVQRLELRDRVRELEKKIFQFEQDAQREREEAAAKLSEATRRVKELEKEKEESQVVLDVDPNAVISQSDSGIDLDGIFSGNEPLDFGPVLSYNDMLSEALELCFDSEIFANV